MKKLLMISKNNFYRLVLFLILNVFLSTFLYADNLIQAPAAIQISSTISDGRLNLEEIIRTAKNNKIKIVILTERDFMKWEYGLWPWRKIIKKTIAMNSVATYGLKRYLQKIEEIQRQNPDMIIIPGVESAPFYYWEGSLLKKNLKICNWHKHLLVIGMDKEEDYKNLPAISNDYSLALPFRVKDFYRFWPILTLLAGVYCLKKRKFNYQDFQGASVRPYSRIWRISGMAIIVFSLLSLFNNFPFREFRYDQYHGEQGTKPYQNFINYVINKNGMVFWAHPEAENVTKRGNIGIETREYPTDLLTTHDYTGFAIFYDGYKKVGCPGGIWDKILIEYCKRRRKAPIWAIGGLGFDQGESPDIYIKDLQTIFLVKALNKTEVLKTLQNGKMYIVRGKDGLRLDKFIIEDSLSGIKGIIADEIKLQGNPILKISGAFKDGRSELVKVKLIRNGVIIKTFEVMSPFVIDYQDENYYDTTKIYYRLEIRSLNSMIITNPIFVDRHKKTS